MNAQTTAPRSYTFIQLDNEIFGCMYTNRVRANWLREKRAAWRAELVAEAVALSGQPASEFENMLGDRLVARVNRLRGFLPRS